MTRRSANFISAFEFEIIREVFRRSVVEDCLPRQDWESRANGLVRSFIGVQPPAEVIAALLNSMGRQDARRPEPAGYSSWLNSPQP
ncbi:hypothetical protein EOA75_17800 [Mesorhizobium sp. M1A.F.Ca.IN.022.07.1.1]|uniref:hypothetical protein n=1 Tax=unclassified Mesorhizobium TaxID=325217 RepID=UPI000F75D74F|nr:MULTISPECIES: hypothetical protein [unclassified Mesorhizobium]TGV89041.1 hypothetical protein EN801_021135 [Mesorhizobium sp. M00.F.Ca.ET.158.01.1.1]AZO61819.1 hypothetical protein EJ078_23085 [Mesorhizobium sp. M1A.F.Ca.IN.022.06.1.1]MCT2581203.1 hypothetical protein [Mesorhizobium sp. P13.3]MDF3170167.1 hypothetical protein [Mesorhizobium sp. P16.1]MDF3181123.1 hypothetical protein [Mesorhizobium sp. P17.1]